MNEELIILPSKKSAFTVDAEDNSNDATTVSQSIADFLDELSNVGTTNNTSNEDESGSIAGTPSSFITGTGNSIAENTSIEKQPVIYTAMPNNATTTNKTPTPTIDKPKQKCKKQTNWLALLIIIVLFILIIRGISK